MYEKFAAVIHRDGFTAAEFLLVQELEDLANSSSLQFLQKVAGSIVNTSLSELLTLTNLSDVLISSPTNGQVLTYNGTVWVNGAASGGGTWGSITGTLSAQTDLQTALDAKLSSATAATTYVPYTGATGNVDLGAWSLKGSNLSILLNGSLFWDEGGAAQSAITVENNGVFLLEGSSGIRSLLDFTGVITSDKTFTFP